MIVRFTDPEGDPVYINTAAITMMRTGWYGSRETKTATFVYLGNNNHFTAVREPPDEITNAVNQMNELFKG